MRQLSPEFLRLCSPATHALVSRFSSSLDHFRAFASGVALPWEPDPGDAPRAHNHHVDLLVATYAGRYLSYADILLGGLSELNYAAYAHAGRAMVEMVATLRYYVEEQYAPILNRPPVDLSRVLDIHERHLRGSRFDWHAFVYGDYEAMAKKILDDIANKRQKREPLTTAPQLEQINVVTCIEKWALSAPVVMLLYKMFCDLVHPNVGSRPHRGASGKRGCLLSSEEPPGSDSDELACRVFKAQSWPNNGFQPTPYSLRSCLAAASRRG